MFVALILLSALFVVGCALYVQHRFSGGDASPEESPAPDAGSEARGEDGDGCCGMHITCERDSLLSAVSPRVEYFDDEELDRFAGRTGGEYDESEIEEFREVMLTMPPDNIAAWARSLQLREIVLPDAVRDELLLIVSETRRSRDFSAAGAES